MPGQGWIGVDLDGTLAYFDQHSNVASIGRPIPGMVRRVRDWLEQGIEVRIFTARVGACGVANDAGTLDSVEFSQVQQEMIGDWTEENIGTRLRATASKDFQMIGLWDDRCVQVIPNSGVSIEVHT